MLKFVSMPLICLILGFAGGVYWAAHNPTGASQLSAQEEKTFIQAQIALNQKIQAKLEQMNGPAGTKTGAGFLASGASGVSAADINDLKAQAQKQQTELQAHLSKLK